MTARTMFLKARSLATQSTNVVRRIVGIPDYDAYVQHLREHHPGTEPVTSAEFLEKCWEDKYSRPGHRCC